MKYLQKLGCDITTESFGGKASWLNRLYLDGFKIPSTFFFPALPYDEAIGIISDPNLLAEVEQVLATSPSHGLAVRSSSTVEDGIKQSKAGNFKSFLYVKTAADVILSMRRVLESNREGGGNMGIILQEMIDPAFAGVAFSSNPVTASKKEVIISSVKGSGDALVSGEVAGDSIVIEISDCIDLSHTTNDPKLNLAFSKLAVLAKELEKVYNLPLDIEWCYLAESEELVLVQCRPITTIFIENRIDKISKAFASSVEPKLLNSDKIKLRLAAQEHNIKISDGYLVMCNCVEEDLPFTPDKFDFERTADYRGYSVVLLYPPKISRKIVRSFIGDKNNVSNVTRCNRYGVRSLPDFGTLKECLENYYDMVKRESWICSIIVQEIYDPIYTGIIKKSGEQYIVEFAKGHFVAKGVVPMSTYILDKDLNVAHKNEIYQYRHIGIIEGCTLEYGYADGDDCLVSLPDASLRDLIIEFEEILAEKNTTVEFGVLLRDGGYVPYLIDYVKENNADSIDLSAVKDGVISEGSFEGTLRVLDLGDFNESLNSHFHDFAGDEECNEGERTIFYAELPSIKFLDLLETHNSKTIAFVFAKGSLLCHLSVLLRERGIPAIVGVPKHSVKNGHKYLLDTGAAKKLTLID